jgi:hypothetical protein
MAGQGKRAPLYTQSSSMSFRPHHLACTLGVAAA